MDPTIPKRPVGIWAASALTVAWWTFDVWATYYYIPERFDVATFSLVSVAVRAALLAGTVGFWLMRWWGAVVVWTLSSVSYIQLSSRAMTISLPEAQMTALGINTFMLLVWIVPTLVGAVAYRRRFRWW